MEVEDTIDDLVVQEKAIMDRAEDVVKAGNPSGIRAIIDDSKDFFNIIPKARAAKIVRTLIDMCDRIPNSLAFQIELTLDCIKWCEEEKRSFLRMRMETKLASLYLADKKYGAALEILTKLITEVKRLDDKLLLVEIHLIESRVQFAVQNLPKAKAALTASRTNANAINCPPLLQAQIDTLNGELNAAESDYKTAYSYFYEAFEAYNLHEPLSARAHRGFQLLLLAKILCEQPQEVTALVNGKHGLKYGGSRTVEALKAVAKAQTQRSVRMLDEAMSRTFNVELLQEDPIIAFHVKALQGSLLRLNIRRVLEPYSKVEVAHVAKLLDLPPHRVLTTVAEMLLDGQLDGTLDQQSSQEEGGVLVLFKRPELSSLYGDALTTLKKLSIAADTLKVKAAHLSV